MIVFTYVCSYYLVSSLYYVVTCCLCLFFILRSLYIYYFFFFFKQKTAYEMRISDWSSDVCSSDLHVGEPCLGVAAEMRVVRGARDAEIGRASCGKECVSTCRSRWSTYH